MNEAFLMKVVTPYLSQSKKISQKDFGHLFSTIDMAHRIRIVDFLNGKGIYIIEEKVEYTKPSTPVEKYETNNKKELMLLNNEQLCLVYQRGDKTALECLIESNKGLVAMRMRRYSKVYKHKLDDEDLMTYGFMGLMKAAERYRDHKNAKFVTYAIYWIDQMIIRSIADFGFTIRIPVHMFEKVNKLRGIMARNPGATKQEIYEIIAEDGTSYEKFEELLVIGRNVLTVASLNTLVGEDEEAEIQDFIVNDMGKSVEEEVEMIALRDEIENIIEGLTEREQKVIRLRYGFDSDIQMTLEQVGKEFSVTRERIRQIESKVLRRLQRPYICKSLKDYLY